MDKMCEFLATVPDSDTNNFIGDLLKSAGSELQAWIGIWRNDDGVYSWDDGTAWNFTKWREGEPNSPSPCSRIVETWNFLWGDKDCSTPYYFICQL